MRLLPGPRPDVDVAVVEILAFPVERPVVAGHRLDDEVVRLPEPVHDADRILVGGGKFVGHALDEAHVEAAARDHVDGGQLLGAAQRIGPVTDRIAEHQKPRVLGDARQHRKADHHGRRHAGRGLMMLVEHDVEAELVGELPLVVIAVKQIGGDVRIAFAVRQIDAQRAGVIVPGRVIGLLGELVDSHGCVVSLHVHVRGEGQHRRRNPWAAPDAGKCPARSIGSKRAPGIARNRRGHRPR